MLQLQILYRARLTVVVYSRDIRCSFVSHPSVTIWGVVFGSSMARNLRRYGKPFHRPAIYRKELTLRPGGEEVNTENKAELGCLLDYSQ